MAYGDEPISVLSEIESRIRVKHGVFRGGAEFPINEQGLRDELRGWLMAQGIKPDKVRKAQDQTLVKAFISDSYLNKMRYDIRTGRRDDDIHNPVLSLDLDALDNSTASNATPFSSVTVVQHQPIQNYPTPSVQDLFEEKNGVQLPLSISPEQIARAADQVLTARINQARLELAKSIDEKIAKANVNISENVKQSIRDLASSTARKIIEELAPPRQIQVINATGAVISNLGVQHERFGTLLRAVSARDHRGFRLNLWLTGPTGSGKTTAAENVAKALETTFERYKKVAQTWYITNVDGSPADMNGLSHDSPFGADSSLDADYKVVGFKDANGHFHWTTFLRIFAFGGIYVADEIDAWYPGALVALNGALANGWISTPIGLIKRHPDCCIIACANTWGLGATSDYVGRNKLDAATVNRFPTKIEWPIDEKLELAIARDMGGEDWCKLVQETRLKAQVQGLHVIFSPRNTFDGISLLKQGFTKSEVITMNLMAGLKPEQCKALSLDASIAP